MARFGVQHLYSPNFEAHLGLHGVVAGFTHASALPYTLPLAGAGDCWGCSDLRIGLCILCFAINLDDGIFANILSRYLWYRSQHLGVTYPKCTVYLHVILELPVNKLRGLFILPLLGYNGDVALCCRAFTLYLIR